ncbi:hypothetical protein [Bradyrhizobium sp. CCBAU 53421]|uniref:hypothetical protein n=1 Tax=Bradyrhizobium sp. CCBAU 53421 TaxID=1325120 RepID=UPI00188DA76D|nr:hypothetical protein [Bradyrhizobium sp. CCBAU 53421]QOZ34066.1 hypothetical protein XH92_22375 [Bradyrhizobium sp. CCBAU 53421]
MKIIYLLAALMLAPSLATQANAHARTGKGSDRTHVGAGPALGGGPQGYRIVGRQIAAPPWSAACMNDVGPRQCDEPMWVYGSPDYVAQFRSAF